eukprot:393037_1
MSFRQFVNSLQVDLSDSKFDEPMPNAPESTYLFEAHLKHKNCNHNVLDKIFSKSSNCSISEIYLINNVPIPEIPEINPHLDEDPNYRQWIDQIKSFILCKNCWFSLLPHLALCIQHIHDHLSNINVSLNIKNCLNYLNQEETLMHLKFLKDMLRYPFVNKYLFENKSISSMMLSFYIKMLRVIYCTDLYHRKFDNFLIAGENVLEFTDHFFLSSYIYWNRQHIVYLLKSGFKKLICETILNNLTKHYHSGKNFIATRNLLQLVIAFDYVSKTKLLCNNHEKYAFIRQLILTTISVKKLSYYHTDWIVSRFFNGDEEFAMYNWHGKYIKLILYESKTNKHSNEWQEITCKDKQKYKLMMECFNPPCIVRKYRRNITTMRDVIIYLDKPYKEQTLIKSSFYKCKGCLIAVYCSRRCQKIHWNRFNHRQQCRIHWNNI